MLLIRLVNIQQKTISICSNTALDSTIQWLLILYKESRKQLLLQLIKSLNSVSLLDVVRYVAVGFIFLFLISELSALPFHTKMKKMDRLQLTNRQGMTETLEL